MSEFITPPYEITQPDNTPIFLAGPVQGTIDWQAKAAESIISSSSHPMSVISPRGSVELYRHPSPWLDDGKQTPWEKRHLLLARDKGILAMWMAAQSFETPGRAFAQTSRIEFGRIAGWMDYNPEVQFVFGIDPQYQGGNATYFREVCDELAIPVQTTLDEWSVAIASRLR